VNLGYRVGHNNYKTSVKFECNDKYHCIRKKILTKMICQPRLGYKTFLIGQRSTSFIIIVSQTYGKS